MPLFDLNSGLTKTIEELARRVKTELLQHEGNDDYAWALQVVKAIYKEVIKPKHLEGVLKAVIEESKFTPCCAAKVKPHETDPNNQANLLAVKLWRFTWAKNFVHIRSTSNCQYPYSKGVKKVCVNPYHYEPNHGDRADVPAIQVDVRPRIQLAEPPKIDKNDPNLKKIFNHCFQDMSTLDGYGPPTSFIQRDEMAEERQGTSTSQPPMDFFLPDGQAPTKGQFLHAPPEEVESPSTSHHSFPSPNPNSPHPQSPHSYLTEDHAASPRNADAMEVDEEFQQIANSIPDVEEPRSTSIVKEDVAFCEPEHWVSFTYYERSRRVGPPVDARSPYVLVDGYTSPYTDCRISLGYFTNPQRDSGTSRTLLNIGRGARFYYLAGDVFVECLSSHPIYVQSPNCNQRHGWHAATVCQVPTGCNLKVFSYAEFAQQLAECVKYGFDAVYALARVCTIRISFAKGWGCIYRRQNISSTPCWIEAHLNGALEWVDKVLAKMGAPSRICTSFS